MLRLRLTSLALFTLFISACATQPISNLPPVEDKTGDVASVPSQPITPPVDVTTTTPDTTQRPTERVASPPNTAVIALLNDAEQHARQGDYQSAQNRLQRAQRIAPREPRVYYDLAQTHYQLEDYRLTEQVALRGISYTPQSNTVLLKQFWSLIAEARSRAGNRTGAKEAREQAARY